ncbi:MAG: 3-dehydroquinate dehydratase [Bacteroidetes bacterium]|nr:3-dehydroquinate dehydratase [Bacteroidota bacterium]
MKIGIINGPNLNLLGKREPHLYGTEDFISYFDTLKKLYNHVEFLFFQSNIEGEIVDQLHEWGFSLDAIIINAGAYTHTSLAIADAVAAINTKCVEVHISNIFARENARHVSYLGAKCVGSISGFGLKGYKMAVDYLISN